MTRILLRQYPPNFAEIVAVMGDSSRRAVFAYGDAIYAPTGRQPTPDMVAHEETHLRQQADSGGAVAWWDRYLADRAFRLEQEVEAYRAQIASCVGRELRRAVSRHCVASLAKPMYGNLVSSAEAKKLLGV